MWFSEGVPELLRSEIAQGVAIDEPEAVESMWAEAIFAMHKLELSIKRYNCRLLW
jgi:hypothetical protein